MTTKRSIHAMPGWLEPGAVFSTPFEKGCIVAGSPDFDPITGEFSARDSDGVLCAFSVTMPLTPEPVTGCVTDLPFSAQF